jgi:hypothetical protein
MPVKIIIANSDSHARLFLAIVTEGHAAQHALLPKRTIMVIHEKQAGRGIASDVDIRPAILVEIRRDDRHAIALSELCDACFLADIGKGAVTIVSVEGMSAGGKAAWPAFDGNASEIAIRTGAGDRHMFERETHIIGHKQIEMAVAVVIKESAAGTPARLVVREAGGFGDVRESAVTVVSEENILSEVSAKNIVETVVVVIRDANAIGPANGMQSGLLSHVGKCSITIVLVEAVRGAGRRALQARAGE